MRFLSYYIVLLFTILSLQGCSYVTAQSGKTRVVDTASEDEIGGTGTSSNDVQTMAERMAREIANINWSQEGSTPRIAVLPLVNETRFRVDPKLLQNKLVRDLVKYSAGKVQYLARDSEQAVMAERAKKRAGLYDSGETTKAMAGADYLLKGEMRALSKASRQGVSDYIVYSFTLLNAETATILWAGDFETKKVGSVGVIYQ